MDTDRIDPDAVTTAQLDAAEAIGAEHGAAAASWVTVNTEQRAVQILVGIDDGDPEILDSLPAPDLSGQWADGYSPRDLFEDATGADAHAEATWNHDRYAWLLGELCDRFEHGFSTAVEATVQATATAQLAANVTMRATFDIVTPESAEVGDYARSGWVHPSNPWGSFPWGSFGQDSADDSCAPETVTFDNLYDAALFVRDFPGAVWDYSEGEASQHYATGEWKSVTLHVAHDTAADVFRVLDMIGGK